MAHPMVLIHGMWCTGAHLARLADALRARGFDCRVPTLPAHETGVPHPEVGSLSLTDYAAFLERYIADQNFARPPTLVGHSMGGLLAQMLAARLEVFALVLLTPASPAGINAVRPAPLVAFFRVLMRPGFWKRPHKPSWARVRRSACNGLPTEKQRQIYAGLVEESGRALAEIAFWWADRKRTTRVDPDAVGCPVYVVAAGRDRLTPPAVVRKVAARYRGAQLRLYPQRSHWVIDDEETDEMAGEIASWLLPYEQRAARGLPMHV